VYFAAGGDFENIFDKARDNTPAGGYEVELGTPSRSVDPFVSAGISADDDIRSALGLAMDFRYPLIFADPDRRKAPQTTTGMLVRF